jgi:diadenosine tetraphosphatase ApaH/serine/threonine PP2A family protein phosphatase
MRSYTYSFYEGIKYYYDDPKLIEWRRNQYIEDLEEWFKNLNNRLIENKIYISYIYNIEDVIEYSKKNLCY